MIRGIRGATTVTSNDEKKILQETRILMEKIEKENQLQPENISQVIITVTDELTAVFPARALRDLPGYQFVPVMCAREIPVPGSLSFCIRLMVTAETDQSQQEISHIYLNGAEKLRPDLSLTKGRR